jgi:hypothetical protein
MLQVANLDLFSPQVSPRCKKKTHPASEGLALLDLACDASDTGINWLPTEEATPSRGVAVGTVLVVGILHAWKGNQSGPEEAILSGEEIENRGK